MTKKVIWGNPVGVPFIQIEGKGGDDDETGRVVKPSIVPPFLVFTFLKPSFANSILLILSCSLRFRISRTWSFNQINNNRNNNHHNR